MKSFFPKLCLLLFLTSLKTIGYAQTTVTGRVVSAEDGKPLQGVNIVLKGKTGGAQTQADGSFSLRLERGDVLDFSFIGYSPVEMKFTGQKRLEVVLKPGEQKLNDVIVVGYGTQLRKDVTSSIGKVDNTVLETAPRANVGTALQGTVAGVQVVNATGSPGATPLILLRGGASINNPAAPLVVVDGIIRAFNDIPSEDIASMQLLRDAASTAIYGARANNGVILITTKQGKAGTAQVSYKFTGGFNVARQGYRYLDAHDYIYYSRLGNLNSGRSLAQVNGTRGYGLLTDPADLASFDIRSYAGNENLLARGWDTVTDPYGGTIIFKDHHNEIQNLLLRNTHTQDHYVDVTGGNDRGKYYASFDYYDENGIIVGSNYKRYSGDINASYKIKPNLEAVTTANFSTAQQLGTPNSEVNTIYRSLALWPTLNPWLDSAHTLPNPGNGTSDGNPLYMIQHLQRSNETNRITASASLKYDIMPGLSLKVTGMGYYFENVQQSFQEATQTYAQMFSNPPTASTGRPAVFYFNRTFQQQYNAVLSYDHVFRQKHHLGVMVASEYFGQKNLTAQVDGTNAPTDYISTANASTTFAAGSNYSSASKYAIVSAFGRLNYDYDQRFLVQLVGREDGVSNLAPQSRWGFFPGMSAGWNVHHEKFYKQLGLDRYVSSFKPRISYGVNGNASLSSIGPYDVQGVFGSQGNYDGVGGYLNTGIVNGNLQWEQSTTKDLGADFGFLHDRITLLADLYDRVTSNLLTTLTLPGYVGFSGVTTNLGTLQNRGFELTLNANILRLSNGFSWDLGANVSYDRNKVLKLPYNGNLHNRQGGIQIWDPKSNQLVWVGGTQEGQPLGNIYAYKQLGIFKDAEQVASEAGNRVDVIASATGPNLPAGAGGHITPGDVNWLDVDHNDTIDSRDQVYIGNIYPKYTGGFSTTFGFRGFSLYGRFDYAFGHTIYNDLVARTLGQYQGTFNNLEMLKQAWSPTNENTSIPKVYYADQVLGDKFNYTRSNNAVGYLNSNNSRFYEKGNYVACREVTLSYAFPRSLLNRTHVFSQARLYVSGNNLFYLTRFSGFSPEPPVSGSAISGVYAGTYPTPRTYVIGAQVSF